jgi:hypothetical protein
MADTEQVKAATQVYVYGYPMVYSVGEIAKTADGSTTVVEHGRLNAFAPARRLLGPEAKFVSPNNDTLYLIGACDVQGGPLVLDVPDTDDRYYVLQFVDAWTNNFAYVGRRATGTKAGRFLLVPPGYQGSVPDDATVIEAPTNLFVIVGRIQVNGDADLPAVHALQDRFSLAPADPSKGPDGPVPLPTPDPRVDGNLAWWEQFRVLLAAFPPPAADAPFVAAAEQFGLGDAESPFIDPDPALVEVLVAGQQQGQAMVENLSRTALKIVDGWSSAMHGFDYNLDHCELGTIDTPEWKIADRTVAYATRAAAARAGLWGNHGYEAQYDLLWQDEHGDELDGSHTYELTLSPPPPVDAFWSLTMYDEPDYYLVANPIDRYSIGDRTPGLRYGDDGSVTLYLQAESPGPEIESNWLPSPKGRFRPVLRSYQPAAAILSGEYRLPSLRKTVSRRSRAVAPATP